MEKEHVESEVFTAVNKRHSYSQADSTALEKKSFLQMSTTYTMFVSVPPPHEPLMMVATTVPET
jgi:hypothetical protein